MRLVGKDSHVTLLVLKVNLGVGVICYVIALSQDVTELLVSVHLRIRAVWMVGMETPVVKNVLLQILENSAPHNADVGRKEDVIILMEHVRYPDVRKGGWGRHAQRNVLKTNLGRTVASPVIVRSSDVAALVGTAPRRGVVVMDTLVLPVVKNANQGTLVQIVLNNATVRTLNVVMSQETVLYPDVYQAGPDQPVVKNVLGFFMDNVVTPRVDNVSI